MGAGPPHLRARIRPREIAGLGGLVARMEGHTVVHRGRGGGRRVSDVLEGGIVLEMVAHHGMLGRCVGVAARGRAHYLVAILVLIVHVLLAHEVLGSLVLVGAAIVLIAANGLVDVARRELVQLLVMAEDDDGDIDGAQHGELVGLLEETALALEEGDGAVPVVLDGLYLDLPATHGEGGRDERALCMKGGL